MTEATELKSLPEKINSLLTAIVGSKNISTQKFDRIGYCYGLGAFQGFGGGGIDLSMVPGAVVRPSTAKEISEILKLANEYRIPVIPRITGTSAQGALTPYKPGSIVLEMNRMNWIKVYEKRGYVEIGPNVSVHKLNEALAPNYYFPAYAASVKQSSIGGQISINTSGYTVDSCTGKPGDHVLGLEVVLPTGEIIRTGGETLRLNAGPDLTKLYTGGEGLFGVITKLIIRLLPKPAEEISGYVAFDSTLDMVKGVVRMYWDRAPYPRICEFHDEDLSKLIFEKMKSPDPKGATIVFLVDGNAPGEARWKVEKLFESFKKEGGRDTRIISKEEFDTFTYIREVGALNWELIWGGQPFSEIGHHMGGIFNPRLDSFVSIVEEVLSVQEKFASKYDAKAWFYGHVGGPSFHPGLMSPAGFDAEKFGSAAKDYEKELSRIRLKYSSGVGEHGIFPEFKEWFRENYGDTHYEIIEKLKKLFDPNDILSPGRL